MRKFNDYLRLFGVDDEPEVPEEIDLDLPSASDSVTIDAEED